tara:strand:- start:617 stop:838 length:222 start_codon:yes stop_codon:yes gene_type:complete
MQRPTGAAGVRKTLKEVGALLGNGRPRELAIPHKGTHCVPTAVVLDPVLAWELLQMLKRQRFYDARAGLDFDE